MPSDAKPLRNAQIDNLKAIAIVFVVLGHAIESAGLPYRPSGATVYALIYFWHMPLFVFLSGYLTASRPDHLKIISLFIVPYAIGEAFFGFTDAVLYGQSFAVSPHKPNWGMWFLLAVGVWRLCGSYIQNYKITLPLSLIAALAAGYFDFIGREFSLSRIIVFLPFFLLGSYVSQSRNLDWCLSLARRYLVVWFMLALTGLLAYLTIDISHPHRWLYMSYSYSELGRPEWWAFLYRAAFMAAALGWIAIILATVPATATRFSWLGTRTFSIYLLHLLVLDVFKAAGFQNWGWAMAGEHALLVWAIVIAVAVTLTAVTGRQSAVQLAGWLFTPHKAIRRSSAPGAKRAW